MSKAKHANSKSLLEAYLAGIYKLGRQVKQKLSKLKYIFVPNAWKYK